MLVLSRKLHQRIRLGPQIVVTVLQVTKGRVRLGIEAPPEVAVWREELAASALIRANEAGAAVERSVASPSRPSGAAEPPRCC
jgi:carbon storage regulator